MTTTTCAKCGGEKIGRCNPCSAKASARWRAANLEKARASDARRYAANPDKHRAAFARWRELNKERLVAATAAWRKAHPEMRKASGALWRDSNKGRVSASDKVWQAANKEKTRARASSRSLWLADTYVANTLHMRTCDVPPEILEEKRECIQAKRAHLTVIQLLKEIENENI